MEQAPVFEAIGPLSARFVAWHTEEFAAYLDEHDYEKRLMLGPIHRALEVHQRVIHRMRTDPLVVAPFRPAEVGGLEFLYFDGQDADLAILFSKGERHRGRWRTSRNSTRQQSDRRNDQLRFDNMQLWVLVCFYSVCETLDAQASMDGVYIGHENEYGFDWVHRLWSADDGIQIPRPEDAPVLFPQTRVVIRRPETAIEKKAVAIGVHRKKAESKQGRKRVKGDKSA